MKDSVLHALNIGALALWLSVSGFAAVAIWVPSFIPKITFPGGGEATELGEDFTIGEVTAAQAGATVPPEPAPAAGEPLPSPPKIPARTALGPLPEIPFSPTPPGPVSAGMSAAARLAAGRTPGPIYPADSLRGKQRGTVVVQFAVDTTGHVSTASIYSSSGWDLLDREALRTVRSWEYPPGDAMTLIRPIVFQLH